MLRWRLPLGTLFVALLAALCWLDHRAAVPGLWLFPLVVVLTVAASAEVLHLAALAGLRPLAWAVYLGNLLLVLAAWLPLLPRMVSDSTTTTKVGFATGWSMAALALAASLVLVGEMHRYRTRGGAIANGAAACFALVYIGGMLGLVVQLRMLWGIGAVAALLLVVKMGDTGAYAVGKLCGRHPLAPVLSPKKTVEGAIGQLTCACLVSWAAFAWLLPLTGEGQLAWWRPLVFGLLLGGAGMIGDLAESLLKRDVGSKDSSTWLPGLGGVVDMLDSVLLAAPVAWVCFAAGLVGG